MKKIFFLLLFISKMVFADFIGDIASNTSFSSGSSKMSVGSIVNPSSLDSILDSYKEKYTDSILSYGFESVLGSSDLSSWWGSNSTWVTGTMSMCYRYSPTTTSNVSSSICDLFSNTSIDPCDAFPNKVGPYTKLSKSEREKLSLPFKNWCESIGGTKTQPTVTLKQASKQMGVSGKAKSTVADSNFNSDAFKTKQDRADAVMQEIDSTKTTKRDDYTRSLKQLNKSGKGHIVASEIKRLSDMSKSISPEELNKQLNEPKLIFNDIKEYHADTNQKAIDDYALVKMNMFEDHMKIARDKFDSINQTNITSKATPSTQDYANAQSEKIAYIESYIEEKDKGYRAMIHKWAEAKAKEEIEFELPAKVGETYYMFSEDSFNGRNDNPSLDKKAQIIEANYKIRKQQYFESQIMQKWRLQADETANELKRKMRKAMIASQLFNKNQAIAEILNYLNN